MVKFTSQQLSNGDKQSQKTLQSGTQKSSHKKNKKPMKSNITNKAKLRRSGTPAPTSGDQSDDDEGDSSGVDERTSTADEPDAFALSGVRQRKVGGAARRLAGYEPIDWHDDMFKKQTTTEAVQAEVGAENEAGNGSDDDYADVENCSDSETSEAEDDERSVLRSAEKDLVDEFERMEQRHNANSMTLDMHDMALREDEALARRLSLQGSGITSEDFSFEVNMNEDPFHGLPQEDSFYDIMWREAESALWRMPDTIRGRENSDQSNNTQKRVRFEEMHARESSSSSSEDPDDAFPDLFASSDDPMVKQYRALETDQDAGLLSQELADNESFYDFEDEDEKLAFEVDEESDSGEEGSGYDSDQTGDTTDEEPEEVQIAKMHEMKRLAGRPVSSEGGRPMTPKKALPITARSPSTPRPVTPKTGRGPRMGTFQIDPTRATMTTDPEGRKIKILPPSKPLEKDRAFWERARTANSSRNSSPPNSSYLTIPSPRADSIPPRPFTAESTLGSMFNGNLDILRNNDVAGIADDMFPAAIRKSRSSFTTVSTTESSDNNHQDINMQDFLDMDDCASDSDLPPSAPITSPVDEDMFSSFTSDSGFGGSGLLDHFDQRRGVVGSFRRNQHQAKHFSSMASHPAKRASAHEYNALQKGKRGAANTPITPARKKRASQDLTAGANGVRKSALVPKGRRSRGNSLAGISNADLFQTFTQSPF